jgi:hypothetical protein
LEPGACSVSIPLYADNRLALQHICRADEPLFIVSNTCSTLVLILQPPDPHQQLDGMIGGIYMYMYVHVLVHHQPEQDSRFTTCDMHPLYINDDTASYLSSPRVPNLAGKNALHLVAIAWRCSLIVPKKSQSNNQTPEMLLNHDPFHVSTRQRYELHLCRSSPSAFAFPKLPRSNRVDGCQVL